MAVHPADVGQWSAKIPLANVPIHAHVLPTGKVLFWGRRNPPGTADFPSLNQHETHAFVWDPANPLAPAKPTGNQPTDSHGTPINLFCSGHTFLGGWPPPGNRRPSFRQPGPQLFYVLRSRRG